MAANGAKRSSARKQYSATQKELAEGLSVCDTSANGMEGKSRTLFASGRRLRFVTLLLKAPLCGARPLLRGGAVSIVRSRAFQFATGGRRSRPWLAEAVPAS